MGACCSTSSHVSHGEPEPARAVMVALRPKANRDFVFSVFRDGCKNGGGVHMWNKKGKALDVYANWELFGGVLRSISDTNYALCVQEDGFQQGGRLHMWRENDYISRYGQWIIADDGVIRAKEAPQFCLCVKQDGCTNGGHVHMWSYDGVPDLYAQWEIERDIDAVDSRNPGARLLTPVISHFKAALEKAAEVQRESFIRGVEAFAEVLNKMGGGMGDYMFANTQKFQSSKADTAEVSYEPWLLTELPVHEATGTANYVDDSAWMANLWIGWTLEFFVEMFALLRGLKEVKASFEDAYQQTLYKHHNMFQRTAFKSGASKLPKRAALFKLLGGSDADAAEDVRQFVEVGRPIYKFCLDMNTKLDQKLHEAVARRGKR